MTIKRRWSTPPEDRSARIRNLQALLQRELKRTKSLQGCFYYSERRGAAARAVVLQREASTRCPECGSTEFRYDIYSGGLDCVDCGAVR